MTYLYSLFADDHEHGSMRLVATYLDEYAALNHAQALSPNGDGIHLMKYQIINVTDIEVGSS